MVKILQCDDTPKKMFLEHVREMIWNLANKGFMLGVRRPEHETVILSEGMLLIIANVMNELLNRNDALRKLANDCAAVFVDEVQRRMDVCPTLYNLVLFGKSKEHTIAPVDAKVGDGIVLHGEGTLQIKTVVVSVEGKEES